jgi:hypothetical protein
MALIAFATIFPCVVGFKMLQNPDNRFFSSSRKQTLRGDPAELEEMFLNKTKAL